MSYTSAQTGPPTHELRLLPTVDPTSQKCFDETDPVPSPSFPFFPLPALFFFVVVLCDAQLLPDRNPPMPTPSTDVSDAIGEIRRAFWACEISGCCWCNGWLIVEKRDVFVFVFLPTAAVEVPADAVVAGEDDERWCREVFVAAAGDVGAASLDFR
ncbi:hypothetical protein ABW21_db0201480 [Orbilia brochopaga]|nr:hypothetical protein ABW21_db0201480 [Drechslerella brochopaga]